MFNKKFMIIACLFIGLVAIPHFADAAKINVNFGIGLLAGPRYCAPCCAPVYYQPVPVVVQPMAPSRVVIHRKTSYIRPYTVHHYYSSNPYTSEVVEYHHY